MFSGDLYLGAAVQGSPGGSKHVRELGFELSFSPDEHYTSWTAEFQNLSRKTSRCWNHRKRILYCTSWLHTRCQQVLSIDVNTFYQQIRGTATVVPTNVHHSGTAPKGLRHKQRERRTTNQTIVSASLMSEGTLGMRRTGGGLSLSFQLAETGGRESIRNWRARGQSETFSSITLLRLPVLVWSCFWLYIIGVDAESSDLMRLNFLFLVNAKAHNSKI